MNIGGSDRELKMIKEEGFDRYPRIGDRLSETYKTGEVTVRVVYTVTRIWVPDDEGCEGFWCSAVISVEGGGGGVRRISALGG
jgi:hypothetical protein